MNIFLMATAPCLSLFFFSLSCGLMMTLLPIRLQMAGASEFLIGSLTAAYFAGFVIGSLRVDRLIFRIQHIRLFASFASIMSILSLVQGLFIYPKLWIFLRFLTGICNATLFIIIEGWLLVISSPKNRGQMLSLYMIILYGSLALGQFLMNVSDIHSISPFLISSMLYSVSIIPLSLMFIQSPKIETTTPLGFIKLYNISPTGVIGSFSAGLIMGAIYGLIPLFLHQTHSLSVKSISIIMAVLIVGAMTLQYPIGKISDLLNRRKVLISMCVCTILCCFLILFSSHFQFSVVASLFFIFGGVSFTLYPISISHTCDYLTQNDMTSATQGLMFAYSGGEIIGPLLAPHFMSTLGPNGLFIYFIWVAAALGLFLMWRNKKMTYPPSPTPEKETHEELTFPSDSKTDAFESSDSFFEE